MHNELTPNAQAILLLTAPLLAGRRKSAASVNPLSLTAYNKLAQHLVDNEMRPAHLLTREGLRELHDAWSGLGTRRSLEDVHRLLGRGHLLVHALERWSQRAIWVVTRADVEYPSRPKQKRRMWNKAPPVLYGCGDRGLLEGGGLAVVGSRNVSDELIEYTVSVGRLAAEAGVNIVSGSARGVDQAAMSGSIEEGGCAIGVLGHGLERAALNRANRESLMDGRLALVSAYDPSARFRAWRLMDRNKHIYALSDAALVVNSDHGHGGTWAGATEQLRKLRYVPVYVRRPREEEPSPGLNALLQMDGARPWKDPSTPQSFREIVSGADPGGVPEDQGEPQTELFPPTEPKAKPEASKVREGTPAIVGSPDRVDINRASASELEELHGIGPVLANRIVEKRETGGRFSDYRDLQQRVEGIGPKKVERIRAMADIAPAAKEEKAG